MGEKLQQCVEKLIPLNWHYSKSRELGLVGTSYTGEIRTMDWPEWARIAFTIPSPIWVGPGALWCYLGYELRHFGHVGEIERAFQTAKHGGDFTLPKYSDHSYSWDHWKPELTDSAAFRAALLQQGPPDPNQPVDLRAAFGEIPWLFDSPRPRLFPGSWTWTDVKETPSTGYSLLPSSTNVKESPPTGYSPFLEWLQSKYTPKVDHLTSSFEKSFNNYISSPPLDRHGFTPALNLKLFDPESKLHLSSYGSLAPVNSFGSGGLPSIIGTPALRQAFENYSKLQERQRNEGQTLNVPDPLDVKLFDFNSRVKMGLSSFHNQWNVSPYSDANQSTLFTENPTPRSGIESRSFYDPAPNFHTQFRLSTPTSLTSHTLGGSQLGFNPFAGSGLGGLGGASNIGSPLFNNWSMYNPSQNLSTLGSGANPAPFGGVGAGFSR